MFRVTKGRVELPCLTARRSERRADQPSVGARHFHHLVRFIEQPVRESNRAPADRLVACGLRGRRPQPIDERAVFIWQCVGQELNLQCPKAGGLQPLGHANAQPTRILEWHGSESNRQTITKV